MPQTRPGEKAYSQKETSLAKPLGHEVAEWRARPALANEPCAGARVLFSKSPISTPYFSEEAARYIFPRHFKHTQTNQHIHSLTENAPTQRTGSYRQHNTGNAATVWRGVTGLPQYPLLSFPLPVLADFVFPLTSPQESSWEADLLQFLVLLYAVSCHPQSRE